MQIDRYEILKPLGAGGMAEVFLARMRAEAGVERLVAIKRLLPQRLGNQAMQEMFIDEARISARLLHSNIAQTLEFGKDRGYYFIVMEYVHGLSLYSIARQRQTCLAPPPMAAFVVARLCEALQYAHALRDGQGRPLNIVHRDLNPGNVMLTHHGEVKLIDFGIARASSRVHQTTAGAIKGSIGYMSPEQVKNTTIDHRSDIFVAGTLLFELLVGQNPFRTPSTAETLNRVLEVDIQVPGWDKHVPADLTRICARALAREPDARYPSAGEMQQALDHHCHEQRYGSRQLAGWMTAHFPELEPKLAQLQTAPRVRLEDFPSGGTQAESGVDVAAGATALETPTMADDVQADPGASRDAYAATVLMASGSAPDDGAHDLDAELLDDAVETERHPSAAATVSLRKAKEPALAAVPEVDAVPTPFDQRDTVLKKPEFVPRPTGRPPRPARRRQRLLMFLGLTALFLGVAAVIVWFIGFGGERAPAARVRQGTLPMAGAAADMTPLSAEGQAPDAAGPPTRTPHADAALPAVTDPPDTPRTGAAVPAVRRHKRTPHRRRWRRPHRTVRRRKPAPRPGAWDTTDPEKAAATKKKALGDQGAEW